MMVEKILWWTACFSGSGCCLQTNNRFETDKQAEWKEKARRSKGRYIIICFCHVLTKGKPLQTRHAYKLCQDMNWWVKSYRKPYRIDNYSISTECIKNLLQFSTAPGHLRYEYKNIVLLLGNLYVAQQGSLQALFCQSQRGYLEVSHTAQHSTA